MAIINFTFSGSTSNAGNYYGFSFYLTGEGASTEIGTTVALNSIYFEATSGSSSYTTPVYLNIWEKGASAETYTYLGSSTNADYCTSTNNGNKSATWNFTNISINPASKYVVIFSATNPSSSWSFNQYGRIPVYPVTNDALHTVYNASQSNPPTASQAWAPKMTLTLEGDLMPHTDTNAKLKLKIMTAAQLENESRSNNTFYVNTDTNQLFLGNKLLAGTDTRLNLKNTATGMGSLTISGTAATGDYAFNIGGSSSAVTNSLAIGYNAKAQSAKNIVIGEGAKANAIGATAIGRASQATALGAIAFGNAAINNETGTFKVSLNGNAEAASPATDEASGLYTVLKSDGTIPAARLATKPLTDGIYVPALSIVSGVETVTWVQYTPVTSVESLPAEPDNNTVYVVTGEE